MKERGLKWETVPVKALIFIGWDERMVETPRQRRFRMAMAETKGWDSAVRGIKFEYCRRPIERSPGLFVVLFRINPKLLAGGKNGQKINKCFSDLISSELIELGALRASKAVTPAWSVCCRIKMNDAFQKAKCWSGIRNSVRSYNMACILVKLLWIR